jgi:hypothetical protein
MGISVEWINPEQTILLYTFDAVWCWDNYDAATVYGYQLIAASPYWVDAICDLSRVDSPPPRALSNFARGFCMPVNAPPNLNRLVMVGASGLLRVIGQVVLNRYPQDRDRVLHALTLEQAYQMLT